MRTTKFRAWTGVRMEYKVVVGMLGAFYAPGMDPLDAASLSQFNTKYSDQTPVMQFTGLCDKNGKEIYEGDVLRVGENLVGAVDLLLEDGNGERICAYGFRCETTRGLQVIPFDEYAIEHCEVVGNIHENPELLRADS